jgi:hypothetical protein
LLDRPIALVTRQTIGCLVGGLDTRLMSYDSLRQHANTEWQEKEEDGDVQGFILLPFHPKFRFWLLWVKTDFGSGTLVVRGLVNQGDRGHTAQTIRNVTV